MTPLIIGFAVVVALLVAVVVDASAAYLRRQGLNSAADAAALAATDGVQGEQVYTQGLGKRAEIDPVAARRYVAEYFATQRRPPALPRSRLRGADHGATRSWSASSRRWTCRSACPAWARTCGVTGTAASVVVVSD